MFGQQKNEITIGLGVLIVMKEDQHTGIHTEGYVAKILTKSKFHPHGIKVQLETGEVGRVKGKLQED